MLLENGEDVDQTDMVNVLFSLSFMKWYWILFMRLYQSVKGSLKVQRVLTAEMKLTSFMC